MEENKIALSEDAAPVYKPWPSAVPEISQESINKTQGNLALLQSMVKTMLVRDRDYGRPLGQPADDLWDSGAALIISAFNCYAGERRILKLEDNEYRITVILEVPLLSYITGKVMATGVGAASTQEGKYKYRWVNEREAADLGFSGDLLAKLKMRDSKTKSGTFEYRVPNPEHGELLNTLLKMASKRGEVDAAKSLPAVGSALRELFAAKAEGSQSQRSGRTTEGRGALYTYSQFWTEVRQAGITNQDAYTALGVSHLKDWQTANPNKSLHEAIKIVREWAVKQGMIEEGKGGEPWPSDR